MFLDDREVGGSLNMACQESALEAQMEELPVPWERVCQGWRRRWVCHVSGETVATARQGRSLIDTRWREAKRGEGLMSLGGTLWRGVGLR